MSDSKHAIEVYNQRLAEYERAIRAHARASRYDCEQIRKKHELLVHARRSLQAAFLRCADPLVPSAWTPEITTYAPPKHEGAPQ